MSTLMKNSPDSDYIIGYCLARFRLCSWHLVTVQFEHA